MKKIKMQDIAKMCGVSVATVSYVLNNKKNSRVSEPTKQKILQIANLYNYRYNPYARSLATGEIHNILFFYHNHDFSLYRAEILSFIDELSSFLRPYKYNITIAPSDMIAEYNYVDAILTYRVNKDTFKEIGELNYIPLISIDCHIDDNLYFEINNSFNNIPKNQDNLLVISLPYKDIDTVNRLKDGRDVLFIDNFESLRTIVRTYSENKKLIVINKEIHQTLLELNINHTYIRLETETKFKAIVDAINLGMSHELINNHKYLID